MSIGPVTLRDGIVGGSSFILGAGAGYAARGKWSAKPATIKPANTGVKLGLAGLVLLGLGIAAKSMFGKKSAATDPVTPDPTV
jgi:hypothetical protein